MFLSWPNLLWASGACCEELALESRPRHPSQNQMREVLAELEDRLSRSEEPYEDFVASRNLSLVLAGQLRAWQRNSGHCFSAAKNSLGGGLCRHHKALKGLSCMQHLFKNGKPKPPPPPPVMLDPSLPGSLPLRQCVISTMPPPHLIKNPERRCKLETKRSLCPQAQRVYKDSGLCIVPFSLE